MIPAYISVLRLLLPQFSRILPFGYKLASDGKLPGFKVGGSLYFKLMDIESWIETKKNKEADK